jgi:hypothetical protein
MRKKPPGVERRRRSGHITGSSLEVSHRAAGRMHSPVVLFVATSLQQRGMAAEGWLSFDIVV